MFTMRTVTTPRGLEWLRIDESCRIEEDAAFDGALFVLLIYNLAKLTVPAPAFHTLFPFIS
jgi:hypothetical protein